MNECLQTALETYDLVGAEGDGSEAEINTDIQEMLKVFYVKERPAVEARHLAFYFLASLLSNTYMCYTYMCYSALGRFCQKCHIYAFYCWCPCFMMSPCLCQHLS